MPEIKFIEGGIFLDHRGQVSYVNNLDMSEVERFYIIQQNDSSIIRGWHGHQREKKWFYVVKGSFTLAFVKVDNWENPSPDLKAEIFQLSAKNSGVLYIPEGYANAVKANEPDSFLLVYSNKVLSKAMDDNRLYDNQMWVDWTKY